MGLGTLSVTLTSGETNTYAAVPRFSFDQGTFATGISDDASAAEHYKIEELTINGHQLNGAGLATSA